MKNRVFKLILLGWFLVANHSITFGQSNDLTGSPYSLFGLGGRSNSGIGRVSAIGRSGIALPTDNMINTLNPASFGAIPQKSFLLDVGFLGELNAIENRSDDDNRWSANFSNLAVAFSINDRSGMGISLLPFTDVGYALIGLESTVEGSNERVISNISGSGGLNEIALDYGYQLTDQLQVGVRSTLYFGSIKEDEEVILSDASLLVQEDNYYSGFRFGLGLQYDINKNYGVGFTLTSPSTLGGSQDRYVTRKNELDIVTEVEDEDGIDISSFKLPLELGFGTKIKPIQGVTFSMDYTHSLWGATDQRDNIGTYVDQSIFSIGGQYRARERGLKYWQNIEFRAGFMYDSGYLKVGNQTIDSYNYSLGIGLPVSLSGRSMLNISYTNGQRGAVEGILLREEFHRININLSLKDIWFKKPKYN